MSEEVARRAIDLLAAAPYEGMKHIAFFGGEPLMNIPILEFILAYGREVIGDKTKLGFMVSTNGTKLTETVTDLLSRHHVSIQVSVDGTRELQNRLRPLRGNGDSFNAVARNLDSARRIAGNIHGRATVTNLCPDALDLTVQLMSLGFDSVSLQPVHGSRTLELDDTQMTQFVEGYRIMARRGLSRKVSWLKGCVERVARRARAEQFCGAGLRGLTVATDGNFYVCHRLIPLPEFRVGDVRDGVNTEKLVDIFKGKQGVDVSLVCTSCMFRHMCGGGCLAENFLENGDIREPWTMRCLLTKGVCQAALDAYLDQHYCNESLETAPDAEVAAAGGGDDPG
ncbi:MAG: radical SAM protein [bacterium]|nr:radical SAM protein [bacterium]